MEFSEAYDNVYHGMWVQIFVMWDLQCSGQLDPKLVWTQKTEGSTRI